MTNSTSDGHGSPNSQSLLEQLVSLTESIQQLAERSTAGDQTRADADTLTRRRVAFAYEFLGEVLGRSGPTVFRVPRVTVEQQPELELRFSNLGVADAAKVRAGNVTVVLTGLDEDPTQPVPFEVGQRVDSIVAFDTSEAVPVPVAIGNCLVLQPSDSIP